MGAGGGWGPPATRHPPPAFAFFLGFLRYTRGMLTLEIHDRTLIEKVTELLQKRFGGDSDRMMAELLKLYNDRLARLEYSGRLHWPIDGLTYQNETRSEWG